MRDETLGIDWDSRVKMMTYAQHPSGQICLDSPEADLEKTPINQYLIGQ